ncbi:hypothetical protein OA002_00425 [bacterium]|nr:hypothetical protein [bacterium]
MQEHCFTTPSNTDGAAMHDELHAIVDQVEAADPSQRPEAKALPTELMPWPNSTMQRGTTW